MSRTVTLAFCALLVVPLLADGHKADAAPRCVPNASFHNDNTEESVASPTEGVITARFVEEDAMKADLLQMLANFSVYMKNDFQHCATANSLGEACGCFKGENTMGGNEQGVRPNADLSMVCAFLVKYARGKVVLPGGVTWADLEQMAMKSLVFAYSTHKANRLKTCAGGDYWGSTSVRDHVWESSLWAMSVAYSAFFQWDKLSDEQKKQVCQLLKAECNYQLERTIPTGYAGDTKAEENGWETDVLAVTLGLMPNDVLAPRWFARLREFAINSYSQKDDANDMTVIDPDYDNVTVKDLYRGQNLYDDYTLQNHNYFHTSYQNVVVQELGEAALALRLFQTAMIGHEKWKTNALMHNNDKVMKEVLYHLALADGELAMPNGNDWSLFLYDQITSYSTNACFLRDPHALLLENLAYKMIKARQTTTADGSWLLRADVGARRMGVEAHRVMMTWLMHELLPTASMTATDWNCFNEQYGAAKLFTSQNIVRAATNDRFVTFSWSKGLQSYTGYIAANSVDKNKIIVPYRANNTGNLIGWYEVSGKKTNATPVVSGIYQLKGNSFAMNGELNTNEGTLNNRFAIYATPGNAVIYLDNVRANADAVITAEKGGLAAVSVDELTKTRRTLYTETGHRLLDGAGLSTFSTPWVNVDNALGIVQLAADGKYKDMAFGDRSNNNSILTARLYTLYGAGKRTCRRNDVVDRRALVYYSNTTATGTRRLFEKGRQLVCPEGWNGAMAADPDSTIYLLLCNFASDQKCKIEKVGTAYGAPVFNVETYIEDGKASASFVAEENHAITGELRFFISGKNGIKAVQDKNSPNVVYLKNLQGNLAHVDVAAMVGHGKVVRRRTNMAGTLKLSIVDGKLLIEETNEFPEDKEEDLTVGYNDITANHIANASFEEDVTYGDATGHVTLGGNTYSPCYVNTVQANDSRWPNILPVKGWTPANTLHGGSKFCRMYSMPYSTTLYCASPGNVGNYVDRCPRPIADGACGNRTLTVLNSWDKGGNAITQQTSLDKGKYRLLMNARYVCTNESRNDGQTVVSQGGNVNTSLTGIITADKTFFQYPTQPSTWQQLCYDFELAERQLVTISLGFGTSAAVGAANNSLLYIDNLRLLASKDNETVGIRELRHGAPDNDCYDLQGRRVGAPRANGIYIANHKKIVFK